MDPVTLGVGVVAVGFGSYTSFLRARNPEKLGKLQAMQEKWGKRTGSAIHIAAYSVVPLAFGVTMIAAGLGGVSLFS
jgi:hypothetical protein